MFISAPGVEIPFPEKIEEKYCIYNNVVHFNISYEKIENFTMDFLNMLQEPCFLILHVPLTEPEEAAERQRAPSESFHEAVYYLNGQTKSSLAAIIDRFGDLFFQDGMSKFGIASHKSKDELFFSKYKVAIIWSRKIEDYFQLLEQYQIRKTDQLTTAWDTFSRDNPGECHKVELDGQDIYDAIDELSKVGLYRAKIVEG